MNYLQMTACFDHFSLTGLKSINFKSNNFGLATIAATFRRFVFRHGKNMTYLESGEPLLSLPGKDEAVELIDLTVQELTAYKAIEKDITSQYLDIAAQGVMNIRKHCISILAMVESVFTYICFFRRYP